jgi:hypothetical protein
MAVCYKAVLVTYLESNKIVKIPADAVDEVKYLEQQFKREFHFHLHPRLLFSDLKLIGENMWTWVKKQLSMKGIRSK